MSEIMDLPTVDKNSTISFPELPSEIYAVEQYGTVDDDGNLVLKVAVNDDNYISGYAVLGDVQNSTEVAIPLDEYKSTFWLYHNCYRLVDGALTFDASRKDIRLAEELKTSQTNKQDENNRALASYLATHPLTWTDGKQYGITQSDQQEISLNLTQYQLALSANQTPKLEWHAVHEECREFTAEELMGLAMAITQTVYPLIRKNQALKAQIFATTTMAELEAIVIDYDT